MPRRPKEYCCQVCGEVKPRDSFYKYKCYSEGVPPKVVWCRECMKMHWEMLQEEKKQKDLEKTSAFILCFP